MDKQNKNLKNNRIFHFGVNKGLDNSLFISIIFILTATASFGLGRLSKDSSNKESVKFIDNSAAVFLSGEMGESTTPIEGQYVASKSGTKYHFPWCSGAQRIKEENKVWFNTKEEAEKAGYEPASNCKGL